MQIWLYWHSGKSHEPRWLNLKQNPVGVRVPLVVGMLDAAVEGTHLGGPEWEDTPCALDLGAWEERCAVETDGHSCAMGPIPEHE